MQEINSVGGFKLLDSLDAKQIDLILDEIIIKRLKLMEL